jgi:hypothetical protein
MIEQIHKILCAIVQLYSKHETDRALPPALLYDIAKFTEYVHLRLCHDDNTNGTDLRELFKKYTPL